MSTLCVEAESGLLISELNADIQRPPASMVKMMMLLLVAEGLRDGQWTLETPITITERAQGMGGTQVFLKEGEVFPLDRLMSAVAVGSANDAAMAVAEGLWGSEDSYKKRMNERAAELGMTNSVFHSVHGLPPAPGQDYDLTTARDMARLAQECVKDPTVIQWTSQKELVFRPGEHVVYSTNKLLFQMEGCDGVKTGYIRDAGFCVTASAVRDGIRLIAVVMGSNANHDRFSLAQQLLEESFAGICKKRVVTKGSPVGPVIRVANSEVPRVQLTAADDLWVIVKRDDADKVQLDPLCPVVIRPPVQAGAALGEVSAGVSGKSLGSVPLTLPMELKEAGWRWKLRRSIAR